MRASRGLKIQAEEVYSSQWSERDLSLGIACKLNASFDHCALQARPIMSVLTKLILPEFIASASHVDITTKHEHGSLMQHC